MSYEDKLPPHSLEAEAFVIAAILVDPKCLTKVSTLVDGVDFWHTANGHVYQAIIDLNTSGETPNFISIIDRLEKTQKLAECGGKDAVSDHLSNAVNGLHSSYGVEAWAKIIKTHSVRREILDELGDLRAKALETQFTNEDIAKDISSLSNGLNKEQATGESKTAAQIVDESIAIYEAGGIQGTSTGFEALDTHSGGMVKSGLYIVAARPSQGKSALLMNMLERHQRAGRKVGAFPLEMSAKQNMDRLTAMRAGINSLKVRGAKLDNDELALAREAWHSLRDGFYMNDREGQTVSEIAAQTRVWVAEHGVEIIMVDYLQIIKPENKSIDRHLQIGEMTRGLKNLARELDIVVIAACQLSRESEKSKGRPMLSHLKESGDIEQDADGVIGIYKDMKLEANSNQFSARWEIEIGWMKNRHGGMGHMNAYYHTKTNRFTEMKPDFS